MKACVMCNSKGRADVPGGPIEHSGTTSLRRPVSAVAVRWGFVSPEHVIRVFRATRQITPSQYGHPSGSRRPT